MININSKLERVWIGIGSNLLNPMKQVDCAISAISKFPVTKIVALSSRYCSAPLGKKDQPNFLNMVVVLDTKLFPEILLSYLQYTELQQGRIRNSEFWSSRTIDLDILLFGKYVMSNFNLTIPHYDILNREFVLYPLIELDCNLIFPNGGTVLSYIQLISKNGLTLWKI